MSLETVRRIDISLETVRRIDISLESVRRIDMSLETVRRIDMSLETVRRIDMSLESTLNDPATYLADGIKPKAELSTALIWDNFDINLGTPSGSHTIYYIY